MDLDLNQEPLEPSHGSMLELGSLINELETAHGRIEERIRRLEAVTPGDRWHRRWRQPQSTDQVVDFSVVSAPPEARDGNGPITAEDGVSVQERMVTNGRNGKQYGTTFLVAKALATDMDDRKAANDGSEFFDCNICLHIPKDPVLTSCGHLFCWPCFYQLSYVYSNVKECPACNGEVTDTGITPIYGNGNGDDTSNSKMAESGLIIPPRPHANRAETLRQQLINRRTSSALVREHIHQQEDLNGGHVPEILTSQSHASQVLPSIAIEGNQGYRSLQASRPVLQGAASFSSLSSALNSAMDSEERLEEDLEAYINNHGPRRRQRRLQVDTDSLSHIIDVSQPGNRTRETADEIGSTVPPSASYMSNPVAAATAAQIVVDNLATNTVDINGSAAMSSSSRIRSDFISSTVPPSASYTSSPVAAATAAQIAADNHATNAVDINGSAAMSSSSRIQSDIPATSGLKNAISVHSNFPSPSSSIIQTDLLTVSDLENAMRISSNFAPLSSRRITEAGLSGMDAGVSHEPRRRRIE